MDNSINSTKVATEGYNLIRHDRDRQGGGVCAYIRNDIAFKERFDLDNASLEWLWFEVLLPKTKPIVLSACYRPPNQTNFSDLFEQVLFSLRSDSEWFILGDIIICVKQKQSLLYRQYEQILKLLI